MTTFRRYVDDKSSGIKPVTYTDAELGLVPGQDLLNNSTTTDSDAQTAFLMRLAQQRQGQSASRGSRAYGRSNGSNGSKGSIGSRVYQAPVVDKENPLGSLAGILGPSPEERAAEEEKLRKQKAKMQGWAGLFNGLRHLGNLYYSTKSATPQQYKIDPAVTIEQNYQAERERLARQRAERRQYYSDLWNLQRQDAADRRKDELHQAQLDWYGTRDEVARMKAENDKLKTEKWVELQDGRIAKVNAETGKIEELLPYQKQEIQSRTNKNNQMGSAAVTRAQKAGGGSRAGTYGYKTTKHIDPATGDVITERVPTTGTSTVIRTGVDWNKKKK